MSDHKVSLQKLKDVSSQVEKTMPWINGISSEQQYRELLQLIDQLIESPFDNRTLITLLSSALEQYEEESQYIKSSNTQSCSKDNSAALLRSIIEQHQLSLSDLPEVGDKKTISEIIQNNRSMTPNQIHTLSTKFNIPLVKFC